MYDQEEDYDGSSSTERWRSSRFDLLMVLMSRRCLEEGKRP